MVEEQVAGVILAGGKSSRFGSNKALAQYQGMPMVQRIADRLAPLFSELLLVTNTPQQYAFLGWAMTGDRFPDCGPMAGIHAALSTVSRPAIFACGCDMPLVEPRLVRYLCALAPGWDVVLPRLAEGPEPLYAVYGKNALPAIEENLRQGHRKLGLLFASLKVREVGEEELLTVVPDLGTFHNVNRQHDLAAIAGEERDDG